MLRKKAEKILQRNNYIYERFVDTVFSAYESKDYEKTLENIKIAAGFAWSNHTGRFSDARLENIALAIGQKLVDLPDNNDNNTIFFHSSAEKTNRKKVLHIATTVYETGGHTRLIRNWIKAFPEFTHSLIITDQHNSSVPEFLIKTIDEQDGKFIVLPAKMNFMEKAKLLQQIACNNFDYVLLHHHPNDVIPIAGLANKNCPPVALVNHADHIFWIGTGAADLVIDFCRSGEVISKQRRSAKETVIVPYLMEIELPQITKYEARHKLGIKDDDVVLISIGQPTKYEPIDTHNFFITTKKILEQNPQAKLFIIGPNSSQGKRKIEHERMIFLGTIKDPMIYEVASDIYLDGFPLSGGMGAVETVLLGACPVFAYAAMPLFSVARLLEFEELADIHNTELEYIAAVNNLIKDKLRRKSLAEKFKSHIISIHAKENFSKYADLVFTRLDNIKHNSINVLDSSPQKTNEDICLVTISDQGVSPVILENVWKLNNFTIFEMMKLFVLSIYCRDTELSYNHLRSWGGTIFHKLIGSKP